MIELLRWPAARDEAGATLLEFAFASVIFFMTLFGTIEFGRAVWQYNMMSDLAQEGARWAAVHGSGSSSPATTAQLCTYIQGRAPFSTSQLPCSGIVVKNGAGTAVNPSSISSGSIVNVQVSTSFTPLSNLIPHSTMTLTGIAKMVVQR